jgi:hypothetical protein
VGVADESAARCVQPRLQPYDGGLRVDGRRGDGRSGRTGVSGLADLISRTRADRLRDGVAASIGYIEAFADYSGAFADYSTAFADHTGAFADCSTASADYSRAFADCSTASADYSGASADYSDANCSRILVPICRSEESPT